MSAANYWVYILQCENNTYYTGYTTDLARRYQQHVKGTRHCKYTRSFKPVCIAQSWQIAEKSTAMRIEHFIKKLSRQKKMQLILNPRRLDLSVVK